MLAQIREAGHTVSYKGRRLKIQYATQTGSKPPVISFWCNAPDLVDDNFERFMSRSTTSGLPSATHGLWQIVSTRR